MSLPQLRTTRRTVRYSQAPVGLKPRAAETSIQSVNPILKSTPPRVVEQPQDGDHLPHAGVVKKLQIEKEEREELSRNNDCNLYVMRLSQHFLKQAAASRKDDGLRPPNFVDRGPLTKISPYDEVLPVRGSLCHLHALWKRERNWVLAHHGRRRHYEVPLPVLQQHGLRSERPVGQGAETEQNLTETFSVSLGKLNNDVLTEIFLFLVTPLRLDPPKLSCQFVASSRRPAERLKPIVAFSYSTLLQWSLPASRLSSECPLLRIVEGLFLDDLARPPSPPRPKWVADSPSRVSAALPDVAPADVDLSKHLGLALMIDSEVLPGVVWRTAGGGSILDSSWLYQLEVTTRKLVLSMPKGFDRVRFGPKKLLDGKGRPPVERAPGRKRTEFTAEYAALFSATPDFNLNFITPSRRF